MYLELVFTRLPDYPIPYTIYPPSHGLQGIRSVDAGAPSTTRLLRPSSAIRSLPFPRLSRTGWAIPVVPALARLAWVPLGNEAGGEDFLEVELPHAEAALPATGFGVDSPLLLTEDLEGLPALLGLPPGLLGVVGPEKKSACEPGLSWLRKSTVQGTAHNGIGYRGIGYRL